MTADPDQKALQPREIETPSDFISIGAAQSRYDGPAKVTGTAHYAADTHEDRQNLAYAELVLSTIAAGRIESIDSSAARALDGVIEVLTHENWPGYAEWGKHFPEGPMSQTFQPMTSPEIIQHGQIIGVVVATSLQAARHAVDLIEVGYDASETLSPFGDGTGNWIDPEAVGKKQKTELDRGDPGGDYEKSEIRLDLAYVTARQTHNAMEPHATVAEWDGDDRLTIDEPSQYVQSLQNAMATLFALPRENVHIRSPYIGGGFGSKSSVWPHTGIAALCAKRLKRPVKLVLEREAMFTEVGYRPATRQELRLGAGKDGRLRALVENGICQMAPRDIFSETVESAPSMLYDIPSFQFRQYFRKTNAGPPIMMRAPGEAPGSFGIECAMDELAHEIGMDPLQLRILNHADLDPSTGKSWSSKGLLECYEVAAGAFGWRERDPKPRSMRENGQLVGFGMASSVYPGNVGPASAEVRIEPDGSATVVAGTHDLGTGTYTILQQVAADALELELDQVNVRLGDSRFPPNMASGGSNTASSTSQAVLAAANKAREALIGLALQDPASPLHGLVASQVTLNSGILTGEGGRQERVSALIERRGGAAVVGKGRTIPTGKEQKDWETVATGGMAMTHADDDHAYYSFGAQFVEVHVDELVKTIRVKRMTAAFDIGRVLNRKTARSQAMGGMVLGIGTALTEESVTDPATHMLTNANLADYLVATNADVPPIDIHFVETEDRFINALGVKGVGEIGVTGTAAAIANAVFHATGKRLRHTPIKIEDLLD